MSKMALVGESRKCGGNFCEYLQHVLFYNSVIPWVLGSCREEPEFHQLSSEAQDAQWKIEILGLTSKKQNIGLVLW